MTTLTSAAILAVTGTAFAQAPFTETFTGGNNGWADGPGNPTATAGGTILSQSVNNATDFFSPNPVAPALATIFRADSASSGGAFTGDYITNGITEFSFDINVLPAAGGPAGPYGISARFVSSNLATGVFTQDAFITPGSNSITVSLDPADVSVTNPGAGLTATDILSDVQTIQFFAVSIPNVSPESGFVFFGLDNVSIDVPAPGAAGLLALAGLAATRRRR